MKLLFVTNGSFDQHATMKRATGMAEPLMQLGYEVEIILEDTITNREKVAVECPGANIMWYKTGLAKLQERRLKSEIIFESQPDLVWICGVGIRNLITRPNKKCVVLADHSELYSTFSAGLARRLLFFGLEWLSCIAYQGQICASRYLERVYCSRLRMIGKSPSRAHYSPYAYHPDVLLPDSAAGLKTQERFPGKKLLVYMGSFWENYGFWDMLHAFQILALRRNDFVAILAGRGPEQPAGERWISANGLDQQVRLEGYIPEEQLSAYFTAAHAFLSPLRDTVQDWARCPSKLYMYLPFGKPVVTCPIGEAKELFGDEGHYFEPGNVDALVAALDEVLDEKTADESLDPAAHTYAARAEDFLQWYQGNFHD